MARLFVSVAHMPYDLLPIHNQLKELLEQLPGRRDLSSIKRPIVCFLPVSDQRSTSTVIRHIPMLVYLHLKTGLPFEELVQPRPPPEMMLFIHDILQKLHRLRQLARDSPADTWPLLGHAQNLLRTECLALLSHGDARRNPELFGYLALSIHVCNGAPILFGQPGSFRLVRLVSFQKSSDKVVLILADGGDLRRTTRYCWVDLAITSPDAGMILPCLETPLSKRIHFSERPESIHRCGHGPEVLAYYNSLTQKSRPVDRGSVRRTVQSHLDDHPDTMHVMGGDGLVADDSEADHQAYEGDESSVTVGASDDDSDDVGSDTDCDDVRDQTQELVYESDTVTASQND